MNKMILGLILFLVSGFSFADELAKEKYKHAFSQQVKVSFSQFLVSSREFGQPGEVKFESKLEEIVSGLTKCHMKSMEYFSNDIQNKTYGVVAEGGSYADAKMSMNSTMAAATAAGGVLQEEMRKMVTNSVEYGKNCVPTVLGN